MLYFLCTCSFLGSFAAYSRSSIHALKPHTRMLSMRRGVGSMCLHRTLRQVCQRLNLRSKLNSLQSSTPSTKWSIFASMVSASGARRLVFSIAGFQRLVFSVLVF